jgi:predicted permease
VLQARLKPGVTLQQAEAEIEVVARRVAKSYPKLYPEQWKVQVVSLVDQQIGPFRTTLYTLAAAVALLLLIACGNVANMLLTRATSREREMAIRASLGANRARLVRQLLVESLVLAVAGAAVGCLFAYFGLRALVAAIPVGLIPRQTVIQVNLPVLLFSLVAAAATAVLSGLVPALQTARGCLVEPLKDSGKGTAGGARGHRLSRVLVAAEVALSLVLLAGAGLLMRSFVNLQGQDLGFDPERVLDVRLALPRGAYESAAEKKRLFREVLDRIGALPGVVSASATTSFAPYWAVDSEVEIAGETHVETWRARVHLVSEGHRETLGLRLRRGRFLSLDEVEGARKVAVVNQALAARYFGEDDPIGRTIEISTLGTLPQSPVANPVFEIVGIVADSKNRGIQESALPEVIVPHTVTGSFQRGILVRTSGPPNALQSAVKGAIWQVDRGVAFGDVGSLTDWMRRFSYAEPRLVLVILAVFACVGLVLVALGVFSVVAYSVARQTHEIGIRMALGAERLAWIRWWRSDTSESGSHHIEPRWVNTFDLWKSCENSFWNEWGLNQGTADRILALAAWAEATSRASRSRSALSSLESCAPGASGAVLARRSSCGSASRAAGPRRPRPSTIRSRTARLVPFRGRAPASDGTAGRPSSSRSCTARAWTPAFFERSRSWSSASSTAAPVAPGGREKAWRISSTSAPARTASPV